MDHDHKESNLDATSQGKWQEHLISIDQAMELLHDHCHIVTAMAAAEPFGFFANLASRCSDLQGVTVHCANPSKAYPCFLDESLSQRLHLAVMFLTQSVRKTQGSGRVDYIPQHLSQWVTNLKRHSKVDIFWGSCSVPDKRGFVSLGTGSCYEPEILRHASKVVLEVNPQMPTTYGATTIPVEAVDHFIWHDHEIPTVPRPTASSLDHKIATHVTELIDDGSTLQLGIGSIPNAIGKALLTKRDLGVHTEMINDTMMDLVEAGVVTGRKKSLWPNKIVGAFAFGSRKLYDFIDGNPLVELQPASVVNDPYRIGRNHKMISVNTAVEVDLTGQVCSESIGHQELSGVGGASDTHIGAQRSAGGRGIVALQSQTKKGQSKIVCTLKPGAKISISRNDIDTVVTEHGVAELKGQTVAKRVHAMLNIADPSQRAALEEEAHQAGYI